MSFNFFFPTLLPIRGVGNEWEVVWSLDVGCGWTTTEAALHHGNPAGLQFPGAAWSHPDSHLEGFPEQWQHQHRKKSGKCHTAAGETGQTLQKCAGENNNFSWSHAREPRMFLCQNNTNMLNEEELLLGHSGSWVKAKTHQFHIYSPPCCIFDPNWAWT